MIKGGSLRGFARGTRFLVLLSSSFLISNLLNPNQGYAGYLTCTAPKSLPCSSVAQAHSQVPSTAAAWSSLIAEANTNIDIDMTYISNPNAKSNQKTEELLNLIRTKAAQGVKVRLFLDGNVDKFPGYDDVHTFPSDPNISVVKTPRVSTSFDMNHKKMIIIDRGKKAYVGSANFDANLIEGNIADCGFIVEGKTAKDAYKQFRSYYEKFAQRNLEQSAVLQTQDPLPEPDEKDFSLACSHFPGMPESPEQSTFKGITDLIIGASKTIDIQMYQIYTKDFYPGNKKKPDVNFVSRIYSEINKKCASGVKVNILLDSTPFEFSHFKDEEKRKSFIEDVKSNLGNCLAVSPPLLTVKVLQVNKTEDKVGYDPQAHSKYMIVDGERAWVGSENWEDSYFNGGSNCGIVTSSKTEAKKLQNIFSAYFDCNASMAFDFTKHVPRLSDEMACYSKPPPLGVEKQIKHLMRSVRSATNPSDHSGG